MQGAPITGALRQADAIEVFQERNHDSPRAPQRLPQLADGRAFPPTEPLFDRCLHLRKNFSAHDQVFAHRDKLTRFTKEPERLNCGRIGGEFLARWRIERPRPHESANAISRGFQGRRERWSETGAPQPNSFLVITIPPKRPHQRRAQIGILEVKRFA